VHSRRLHWAQPASGRSQATMKMTQRARHTATALAILWVEDFDGHRLRHPVQPGPRHRPADHHLGYRDQFAPGRDRRQGRHGHRPGRHTGRDRHRGHHQRRPADRAGLRPGDFIRAAGRRPTPDAQALAGMLAAARPGDQVTLSVVRGAQELTVKVTLGELPGNWYSSRCAQRSGGDRPAVMT
jgi:hypothetical protein